MHVFRRLFAVALVALIVNICYQQHVEAKIALPHPLRIGYWGCNPGGHSSSVSQASHALSLGYNVIIFAFFDVAEDGRLIVDPGSVSVPHKQELINAVKLANADNNRTINDANEAGQDFVYLVSLFGGQNGAAPTLSTSPSVFASAMYNNFVSLSSTFGFDGIDIDLENAWGGTPDEIVCALRLFFAQMQQGGYVVSMAPQTTAVTPEVSVYASSSWNSYAPFLTSDSQGVANVDIVAIQLYNNAVPFNNIVSYTSALLGGFSVSGCPSCSDSGATAANCSQVRVQQTKIAHGFPSGQGAAPAGCPGLAGGCPYGSALSSLYSSSSVLLSTGGVMTWSIEWDEASNWQFIQAATKINFKTLDHNDDADVETE